MNLSQLEPLFEHVGATSPKLLGFGATTQVFSIGRGRVIRVFSQPNVAYIDQMVQFYRRLATYDLSFALPDPETWDTYQDIAYVVEKHLPGQVMSDVFPQLNEPERSAAILSFLRILPSIHQIQWPEKHFGECLGWEENVVAETWSQFLLERTELNLRASLMDLRQDFPRVDQIVADFTRRVAIIPDPEKCLVHGDYFLENVMCDAQGRVTAVLDFSPLTVIGDPLMDYAGAIEFLDVLPAVRPDDLVIAKEHVHTIVGADALEPIALYTTYYALYFGNTKSWQPHVYEWCLKKLHAYPLL